MAGILNSAKDSNPLFSAYSKGFEYKYDSPSCFYPALIKNLFNKLVAMVKWKRYIYEFYTIWNVLKPD